MDNTQTTEVVRLEDKPDGVVVARLEVVSFELAPQISEQLLTCLQEKGCKKLVVCVETDTVNSTFLGILVSLHNHAIWSEKELHVKCTSGGHFQEVLGITNLDQVLQVNVPESE